MVICIIMFFVQFHQAILSLLDPPTLDSSYHAGITEVTLPIITVCPTNQTRFSRMKKLRYSKKGNLFMGHTNCTGRPCLSWGHHLNLTSDQLIEQIFDKKLSENIEFSQKGIEENIVILPRFGFCKEFSGYNPTEDILITNNNPFTAMQIFLTDNRYRSYYSLDFSSHQGSNIIVQRGNIICLNVNVDIYSSCKIVEDSTKKVDFQTCVDKKLKEDFLPMIGCVPPWMSSFYQCNATYPNKMIMKKSFQKLTLGYFGFNNQTTKMSANLASI